MFDIDYDDQKPPNKNAQEFEILKAVEEPLLVDAKLILLYNVIANHFVLFQNIFTKTIKDKVGETSTLWNEEGLEVHDGDMERNTATNGEDEGEKLVKMMLTYLKQYQRSNYLNLG